MITLVSSLLGLGPTLMHRTVAQIYGGDFAKICGLLRIYELYLLPTYYVIFVYTTITIDDDQ